MPSLFKTFLLMAALTAIFGAVGYAISGPQGMLIALALGGVMNFITYWNADSFVLKLYRARIVGVEEAPELYRIIEGLAQRAGMPMPKVAIIDSEQPNAFATGRNPENAAVAITTGLMHTLNEREIGAVMAHELSHIQHRDTLTMTITATVAGAIGSLAQMAFFFGHNRERGGNPIISMVLMLLAPLLAMLVQMAISRTREYAADKRGAEISGDPLALASALQKISRMAGRHDNRQAEEHPETAHLFIINPLNGGGRDNFFATHPSTENRIRALNELAEQMGVSAIQEEDAAAISQTRSWRGPWDDSSRAA